MTEPTEPDDVAADETAVGDVETADDDGSGEVSLDVDEPSPSPRAWMGEGKTNADREPLGGPLSALVAPVAGFGITFKTMFKKTVTEEYPEEKFPTAPRYHGRHVLNRHPDGLEKCVGCELCAWACPADAIYVEGADNTDENRMSPGERYGVVYQINYLRCIFCGLCIEACPTRALTMSNEYELADDNREDLIFTKDQLLAPLLPGMEAPPHPLRLGDDEKAYYVGQPITPATSDKDGS